MFLKSVSISGLKTRIAHVEKVVFKPLSVEHK